MCDTKTKFVWHTAIQISVCSRVGGPPDGLSTHGTSPSDVGSVEWAFHRTGFPRLMLDLSLTSPGDQNSACLTEPIGFRSIGALAMNDAFCQTNIADDYDVLIFFNQTNPSVLLKNSAKFLY